MMNLAVATSPPRDITELPMPIASDDEKPSLSIAFGMCSSSPRFTSTLHITPDETIAAIEETSYLPGSGVPGLVAIKGPNPIGYYKDEAKTARTFRVIAGERYSIPGDWVLVEADGTLTLLGRGNACINTAGEKVFPEEVEEALKRHPAVEDALVVGLPDGKWGQAVTGVVTLVDGEPLDEAALRAHVRLSLAGYKTPKRIFLADRSLRASNGKADYPAAKAAAEAALAAQGA